MVSEAERSSRKEIYETERLNHTPWVEKYRPRKLDDIASQENTVKILRRTLVSSNLPHMLYYGPPGTGKTSTVLALAKQLYGPNLFKSRVLELNASDERGISIVRQKIKNFARLTISNPSKEDLDNYPCPPYKIIILDEADSMTNDAQSALRRTMENYSNVTRFCLICNYITRIIDPLASRCSKFRFKLLDNDDALSRLKYIVENEGVQVESGVLEEVLKISNGDLRKAITFLQSAAKLNIAHNQLLNGDDIQMADSDQQPQASVTKDTILEVGGVVSESVLDKAISVIESKNSARIIDNVKDLVYLGYSAQQLIDQLHDKFILDDTRTSITKNSLSQLIFETDRKLTNGTDEHIQMLNLFLQISNIL